MGNLWAAKGNIRSPDCTSRISPWKRIWLGTSGHGAIASLRFTSPWKLSSGPGARYSGGKCAGGRIQQRGAITYASNQVPRLMEKYYGAAQDVPVHMRGTSFPVLPLPD